MKDQVKVAQTFNKRAILITARPKESKSIAVTMCFVKSKHFKTEPVTISKSFSSLRAPDIVGV